MKKVKLSRQYAIGSAVFDAISFREPKLTDYRRLGRPIDIQRGVVIRNDEATFGYVDTLVQDIPPGAINELDLIDAMIIEAEVIAFFTDAAAQLSERANSSSVSAGAPSTSTI